MFAVATVVWAWFWPEFDLATFAMGIAVGASVCAFAVHRGARQC